MRFMTPAQRYSFEALVASTPIPFNAQLPPPPKLKVVTFGRWTMQDVSEGECPLNKVGKPRSVALEVGDSPLNVVLKLFANHYANLEARDRALANRVDDATREAAD